MMFKLVIDIPALTRLVDYLEAKDQAMIDGATNQLQALTQRFGQSEAKLLGAIQPNKGLNNNG